MKVRMTAEMLEALRATPEIPDDMRRRVDDAQPDGDAFVVTLSDDEAMAMSEMCQWYVHRDTHGEMSRKAALFDAVITAIDEAQL